MTSPEWSNHVVPARLAYLAIYNPSLGPSDETFAKQLVFYYSRAARETRAAVAKSARNDAAGGDAIRIQENEQLRNIGLAQGMVDFARSFSEDQLVDSIDTEKSRIVLQELEQGWWILASIDLTQLPAMVPSLSVDSTKKDTEKRNAKATIEYSSREVTPPALLIQQLVQAHHIFSLHNGPSLTEQFTKLPREKFCNILNRFWSRFARTWDVLLHGNPASDIFSGIRLSGGGELGMGVGEEEWGSGEREVLEDLTRRTEGLVDLIVSRFGEPAHEKDGAYASEGEALPWLGSGAYPLASDGIIFGGVNAIARPSLRNLSLWMRSIYTYGEYAYGVRDNPHRERRKRRRRNAPLSEPEPSVVPDQAELPKASEEISARDHQYHGREDMAEPDENVHTQSSSSDAGEATEPIEQRSGPGIPPPIVSAVQRSLDRATRKAETNVEAYADQQANGDESSTTLGIPDQYMKYLTLGLSTLTKSNAQKKAATPQHPSRSASNMSKLQQDQKVLDTDEDGPLLAELEPLPDGQTQQDRIARQKRREESGQFLIGLSGDLNEIPDDPDASVEEIEEEADGPRNVLRTLQVEVNFPSTKDEDKTDLQKKLEEAGLSSAKNDPLNFKRVRVLVYVHRPFIYCFLFKNQTPALSLARFYKNLHLALLPIHKSLLNSTSIERISQRVEESQAWANVYQCGSMSTSDSATIKSVDSSHKASVPGPIYDLIFDPALLTIHTSIPNIPEPGTSAAEGIAPNARGHRMPNASGWTRVEALNVHSQILGTLASVQRNPHEYERTSKTSRGWWTVWMKLSPSLTRNTATDVEAQHQQNTAKESGSEEFLRHVGQSDPGFTAPIQAITSDDTIRQSTSNKWLESSVSAREREVPSTNRIAILVRKGSDAARHAKTTPSTSRAASSMWQSLSLRSSSTVDRSTGGPSTASGPAPLVGGIGFDPRTYVENLLQLNR